MAKTKKLINAADDVVAELVEGMAGAHPDLLVIEGDTRRAIVARDGPREGKVGVVIGGGSGHEPLFSGYVGRGLADAAVIGNIFASPSPAQICDAARAVDGGAGVVFLYGNYTGDVMNFEMAADALAAEGVVAKNLQVHDDVASAPAERREERRGIAGDVFVFKIAGAAADRAAALPEVERLVRRADAATASMGVALGPCSLPQTLTPNFDIGADEMEVGMGIHGEPGIVRTRLEPADAVADRLLDPILSDLALAAGDRVAVMVNGLGSTAMLELYILHRRVAARLAAAGIGIHKSFVGNYATSLEMAGASVTLTKLDDELAALVDHPCRSVALTIGAPPPPEAGPRPKARRQRVAETAAAEAGALIETGALTPALFRAMMHAVARRIGAERARLSELDGAIGDGDHGVTMDLGWRAAAKALDAAGPEATISDLARAMGSAFLDAVGASAGPLYATAFARAADVVADRKNLDAGAVASFIEAMAAGIRDRGGAGVGDKTMLDAWTPAAAAARRVADAGGSEARCLRASADAAAAGRDATAGMVARFGRAAKLGERARGHVDPGAASAALILATIAETLPR